jgi:WD40 repeat protein
VFQGRTCVTTIAAHKAGFISALTFAGGYIYSGGKDGQVFKIDSNCNAEAVIQFDSPVRAIDISNDGKMVCGLRNGSIIEVNGRNQREIMFSHSDGETWGLDLSQYPKVLTSGDDNKVIVWDTQQHKKQVCY